jgi:hypothetical protein
MACITLSSGKLSSKTTAAGLPANRRVVNESS